MKPKYHILGTGPAGLMAAAGLESLLGSDVSISFYSLGIKSTMYGAQYLHQPIPGFTFADPVEIKYQLMGRPEMYRAKVYGDAWDGTVSPEDLEESHNGWDIRETYDNLWTRYIMSGEYKLVTTRLNSSALDQFIEEGRNVINSVPLNMLCNKGHQFRSTDIWAAGEAPEIGITLPYFCPQNTVVCNGADQPAWYRMSNIYGRTTVEWPEYTNPPITTKSLVHKPLDHQCTCWPVYRSVYHVGRYGSWQKGVLSHQAWESGRDIAKSWLS